MLAGGGGRDKFFGKKIIIEKCHFETLHCIMLSHGSKGQQGKMSEGDPLPPVTMPLNNTVVAGYQNRGAKKFLFQP